jgi:hypothetical protein
VFMGRRHDPIPAYARESESECECKQCWCKREGEWKRKVEWGCVQVKDWTV